MSLNEKKSAPSPVAARAGIFIMTAQVAGEMAGQSVAIAFLLAAVTFGLSALGYAEFASTVPVADSAYTFSFATFGELVAWVIGWGLVLEFLAFVGFDAVASAPEETRDPQKSMPRGIIGTLLVVTVPYGAVSVVLTGMVTTRSWPP